MPPPDAGPEAARLYDRLAGNIMDRDQVAASDTLYDLIRAGRPTVEILSETIRTHAPYTHVPYHQRVDDGVVRFVNNDHCLLSARATVHLQSLMPEPLRTLPLAQTVWYVPTGLDIWNQLLGRMPGHYSRRTYDPDRYPDGPAPPSVHWDDQEPADFSGTFEEGANQWLTLVERGRVDDAYRLFLALWQQTDRRQELLAQLVFAGLIDVQDRMLFNRSYTTGHKSYRARATVELGTAIGWDQAHHVLYAGIPDIAVGPRWYSNYEMACQVMMYELDDRPPQSSLEATQRSSVDAELFANASPLSEPEAEGLIRAIIREPEPAYIEELTALLRAGRSPRSILDAIQIAAARVVLEVQDAPAFSMPQHGYEYTNTLAWFYDHFDHPHRTKLLYVAANFINQCARWIYAIPGNGRRRVRPPEGADALSQAQLLQRLDAAMVRLDPEASVAWTQAYLEAGHDRAPLVETLAVGAVKQGNDPHNQEIGLCFIEDYGRTASSQRDTLLLACAQHTAGHMKYGDQLEPYRRYAAAFGLDTDEWSSGAADPADAMLDDLTTERISSARQPGDR